MQPSATRRAVLAGTGETAAALALPATVLATTLTSPSRIGSKTMSHITMKDGAKIYYKDWGTGPVVTFSHG